MPKLVSICEANAVDLKTRVIFAEEGSEKLDILQQYIAFSQELTRQIKQKGRTVEALTAAIEICKQRNILREYLSVREKEVVKIMTMLFDQGYVTEVALKERETKGIFKTLYTLVKKKLLSLSAAAQEAGQTEEEFTAGMKAYFAQEGAK